MSPDAGAEDEGNITKEEALSLLGGEDLRPSVWRRFSLPARVVLLVMIRALTR